MTRPRRNPILLSDEVLVALDKLEDLGAPTAEILGQLHRYESVQSSYNLLLTWLFAHARALPGRPRTKTMQAAWARTVQAWEDALIETQRSWDRVWFAEHAIERLRIEEVFSLTGGELSDRRWYYDAEWRFRWQDEPAEKMPGEWFVAPWWFDGFPEYLGRRWPEEQGFAWDATFCTIIGDHDGNLSVIKDAAGRWQHVESFMASGERECPLTGADEEARADFATRHARCPYCEADLSEGVEHGYIYLGDGRGEHVFVLSAPHD